MFSKCSKHCFVSLLFCFYAVKIVICLQQHPSVNAETSSNLIRFYPRHLKSLLRLPATLKLALIDESTLVCSLGTDITNVTRACENLYIVEAIRIGTYLSIDAFLSLFCQHKSQLLDSNDSWKVEALVPKVLTDTIILNYHYYENHDKYIVINSLAGHRDGKLTLRPVKKLSPLKLRPYAVDYHDLSLMLGPGGCESMCSVSVPRDLEHHLTNIRKVSTTKCSNNNDASIPSSIHPCTHQLHNEL